MTGSTIAPVRVAVYALLLVNLLYFGWAEWIDVPAPPAASSIAALPRLKLVSDLPPAKRPALASKISLQAPRPQCVSVGPFDDAAVAARAATVLRAKSFVPQQRAAEAPAIRRFWVYLDGFTSDAAEMRVLHKLERAGIDDAEAMPADAGGRKISLGLFSDRDHAGRRSRAVQAMGLKPAMAERMLPGTVYWLDLTLPEGSAVPLKDVSDLQGGGGESSIGVQPCSPGSPPEAPLAVPSQQAALPASLPAAPAATPRSPAPKTASPESSPVQATALPVCKPGGGGPVPCVLKRATAHPSVL
jgi:hypothetical protein